MKKRIILAMLLCLAICASLFVIGCDGGPDRTDDPTDDPSDGDDGTEDDGNDDGSDDGSGDGSGEQEELSVKVTFTDAEGNPIADVRVGLCVAGVCLTPVRSDAEGVAVLKHSELTAETTEVDLNVTKVPEGFVKPDGYIKLTLDSFEKTVILERVPE